MFSPYPKNSNLSYQCLYSRWKMCQKLTLSRYLDYQWMFLSVSGSISRVSRNKTCPSLYLGSYTSDMSEDTCCNITLKSKTFSEVCELLQLFIQTAQESPSLCHRVALRAAFNTAPAQIRLQGAHYVTDDTTSSDYRKASIRDVAGPQRWQASMWCDCLCQLESHPVHSNTHGNQITALQLAPDGVFSAPVTTLGPLLVALVKKWSLKWKQKCALGVNWHGFWKPGSGLIL